VEGRFPPSNQTGWGNLQESTQKDRLSSEDVSGLDVSLFKQSENGRSSCLVLFFFKEKWQVFFVEVSG
jgi:hypothetical protein